MLGGIAVGLLSGTSWGSEDGDVQVATLSALGYGVFDMGGVVVSANAGVAGHRFDASKSFEAGDLLFSSAGSWAGLQAFASVEAAYPVQLQGGIVLTPKAGLAAATLWQASHTELAGGLTVDASQTSALQSSLGVEIEIPLPVLENGMDVAFSLEAAWVHQFGAPAGLSASFAGGSSFTIAGEAEDRDSLELGAGLSLGSDTGLTASVGASTELSASGLGGQAVTASLTGSF